MDDDYLKLTEITYNHSMIDNTKTKQKLKKLNDRQLKDLLEMVQGELNSRMMYMSNSENTPTEICNSLSNMFSQAWIHG